MKRLICLFLVLLMLPCFTAFAEEEEYEDYSDEEIIGVRYGDGEVIYFGGIDTFKNEDYSGREEQLEKILQKANYICVYGKSSEISNEELAKYIGNDNDAYYFWFSDYVHPQKPFYNQFYNVYIYRPSYNAFKQGVDEQKMGLHTVDEINDGAVIVDYATEYTLSKYGKVIDEVNDKIPVWWDTGYLQIESPIDCKIRLLHGMENAYYEFYVRANEPFLVKVKAGGYMVTEINDVPIDEYEEELKFTNNFQVQKKHTEFEPYVMELEKCVEKYEIKSIDLEEQKKKDEEAYVDINIYEDVKKEKTEVGYDTEEEKEMRWSLIFLGGFGVIILGCFVAYHILKKKYRGD